MEKLNDTNLHQAIEPMTLKDISADIEEAVKLLVSGKRATFENLPIWYMLAKAAGATGMKLADLYDDPVARYHALGVLAVDMMAEAQLKEKAQAEEQGAVHPWQQQ